MVTINDTDWTRQETLKLSGLTKASFEYFEKMEIVIPKKIGHPNKPMVFYTWNQLLAIRAYAKLKEKCRPKAIKEALEYLNPDNPSEVLRDKRLIASQNHIYWVLDRPNDVYTILVNLGKYKTLHIIATFSVQELIDEIKYDGENCKVANFEEKFKMATHAA